MLDPRVNLANCPSQLKIAPFLRPHAARLVATAFAAGTYEARAETYIQPLAGCFS
jgi:hypothetical protein